MVGSGFERKALEPLPTTAVFEAMVWLETRHVLASQTEFGLDQCLPASVSGCAMLINIVSRIYVVITMKSLSLSSWGGCHKSRVYIKSTNGNNTQGFDVTRQKLKNVKVSSSCRDHSARITTTTHNSPFVFS